MAQISEEEIIQICNNFLLSAPPGEFLEVVTGMFFFSSFIQINNI